jgi:hypothetical protein
VLPSSYIRPSLSQIRLSLSDIHVSIELLGKTAPDGPIFVRQGPRNTKICGKVGRYAR